VQTQRVDWCGLVECLLEGRTGPELHRAQWLACCEVVDHPELYRPLACDERPLLLDHLTPKDVADRGFDAKSERATSLGVVFGGWRAHVTDIEARNAARLLTVAGTLQTLADLHRKSTCPDKVAARLGTLGAFVEAAWHVAIPLQGDVRAWAARITRRYDLLPVAWRGL
jgi:hypothetical protein